MTPTHAPITPFGQRVDELDWNRTVVVLDEVGVAATGAILTSDECRNLSALYDEVERFRSTIDMARHRFGEGQYRYFAHPLPTAVAALRASFWPHLLPIARDWAARLKQPAPWPDEFEAWIAQCHAAGQSRPTPLMLRYQPGDWNALHRDLYGDMIFPLQVVVNLSEPETDYTGGEFVVVEQRPRTVTRDGVTVDIDDSTLLARRTA